MNGTNRFLNRAFLLVVGIVVVAIGSAVTAVALVPAVRDGWDGAAATVDGALTTALRAVPLADTGHSWLLVAAAAALAVIVVVLLVAVFRRGGGRTSTIATVDDDGRGAVTIDTAVAVRALEEALSRRDEFLSSRVTAYRVRREPALYVAVRCRRGVSPAQAADTVTRILGALDALLGVELPALVHVSGGFRSRVASTTRLDPAAV